VRLSSPNWLQASLSSHAFDFPGNRIDYSPRAPKECFSLGPTNPLGGPDFEILPSDSPIVILFSAGSGCPVYFTVQNLYYSTYSQVVTELVMSVAVP
jgi:hypothetical protein